MKGNEVVIILYLKSNFIQRVDKLVLKTIVRELSICTKYL